MYSNSPNSSVSQHSVILRSCILRSISSILDLIISGLDNLVKYDQKKENEIWHTKQAEFCQLTLGSPAAKVRADFHSETNYSHLHFPVDYCVSFH